MAQNIHRKDAEDSPRYTKKLSSAHKTQNLAQSLSLVLLCLMLACTSACKRRPPDLEALDKIDRRTGLSIGMPIERDLNEIRARGSLPVLAPYNSTTYFIYQGEP